MTTAIPIILQCAVSSLLRGTGPRLVLASVLTLLALSACSDDTLQNDDADVLTDIGDDASVVTYSVAIRRTEHGVPHIAADDFGSLGYGVGYAMAQDRVCVMADQYVRIRSERARFFGPGRNNRHITSDFGYLVVGLYAAAESALEEQSVEFQDAIQGFAEGYNRFLSDTGLDNLPPDCAGADWVFPITAVDAFAFSLNVTLVDSALPFLNQMGAALPPAVISKLDFGGGNGQSPQQLRSQEALALSGTTVETPHFGENEIGSNAWGIGRDLSETGRGLLFANPHFPLDGELLFWENHQTIPGQLNAYGANLVGAPFIMIGFNEHLAWTHTLSPGQHHTAYDLSLSPTDPTAYEYGGETRQLVPTEYEIELLGGNGTTETITRTLYRSHFGPMINIPGIGWTLTQSLCYRDANIDNVTINDQWLAMAQAESLDEFRAAHETYRSMPVMTTIAVDEAGDAWYVDSSQVPNITSEAFDAWQQRLNDHELTRTAWFSFGFMMIDGSDPLYEWTLEPGARLSGNVPYGSSPQLLRNDYVANSNNSHWLTNAIVPLEPYSRIFGPERQALSPRGRTSLFLLTETGENAHSGTNGQWSLEELEDMFFGGRTLMTELLLDDVVDRCAGVTEVSLGVGPPVDITETCAALTQWDRSIAAGSGGGLVWRELLGSLEFRDLSSADGVLWAEAFDRLDPIWTPRTLQARPIDGDDPVLRALADATLRLRGVDILPLDDVQSHQFTLRGGELVSFPGGTDHEGAMNVAGFADINFTLLPGLEQATVVNNTTDLTTAGYLANFGASFVMLVSFEDDGPRARGVLTYSQSSDPRSSYFRDQTDLFGQETLRDILFREDQIAASAALEVLELSSETLPDPE